MAGSSGSCKAFASADTSVDLFPPGSPSISISMATAGTELCCSGESGGHVMVNLPSPLTILWLSTQDSATRVAGLSTALTHAPVTNKRYYAECVAVWHGGDSVGSQESLSAIVDLRQSFLAATYTVVPLRWPVAYSRPMCAERASKIIACVGRSSTFAAHGDTFVALSLALMLPAWRTVLSPYGEPPYEAVALELPETVNDSVRPVLETGIKTLLADSCMNYEIPMRRDASLAALTAIQELCSGHPRVYVDATAATRAGPVPAVFWFADSKSSPWTGCFVASDKQLHPMHASTAVGTVCDWLMACRAANVTGTIGRLCDFVLDGANNDFAAKLL